VLRAARGTGVSEWWFLGDMVGYGADPAHCARHCLSETTRCLAGNHDLAAARRVDTAVFVGWAREALEWTAAALGPGLTRELADLMPSDPDHDVPIFHASPRDPVWEYVVTDAVARASLEHLSAPLGFVGHTHVPSAWHLSPEGDLNGGPLTGEATVQLTAGRWLVNPGSVGQPRDGDARASWAIYDTDAETVRIRRTPYDVAGAQNAILSAGLPSLLADRLSLGR
jgi:diadenosine tetraphosphatase ApaH/serine/threonine PP2A family protein phosphatase